MPGIHGKSLSVVSPAGQNDTLSCGPCGGSWHYNDGYTNDVLVGFGATAPNFKKERAERLKSLSNHSLFITDVTTEDVGLYTCRKPTDTVCTTNDDIQVNFSVLQGKFSQENPNMTNRLLAHIFGGRR